VDSKEYRRSLKEIIDGFSTCYLDDKKRYIKHQSMSDVVDFEIVYEKHYEDARERGLPTEKEIFDNLKSEGIWNDSDEAKIETQKFYIDSLQKNKKNLYLKSAVQQINKQIEEAQKELSALVAQKEDLTSNCCERYALNRANDFYMVHSFYKDTSLTVPCFSEEEFEYIEASGITELVKRYNEFHNKFSESNIQNLVLQDFYRIYYAFSESCVDFYGIPIVKLSNFQLNLIMYTRIFKNIFESHDDIPEKIKKDPEALLDFANSSEAREKIKRQMEGSDGAGASTVVGATSEDLEELGMASSSSNSIQKAAQEKGGSLSMKDLMDLSGV